MIAWFNGCAIAPTMRCADPRGSSVSESSVITYRTLRRIDSGPTFTGKLSNWPRISRFRSSNFPRLRSHPIHPRSRGL